MAIATVAVGAIVWSVNVAEAQAVRQAAQDTKALANNVIAPLCTPELSQGDPAALEALDRVVRSRTREGSLLRVKVWDSSGRILYSDAASLIGQTFELPAEDMALLGTEDAAADISALDRPENHLEAVAGARMVETYVGIRDTTGRPLLFEAYFSADRVDANAKAIAWNLTPAALAIIVALQLLQLPLALALARRLDHAHTDRARLLAHAVAAAELERRRIARNLHDGVIQDMAGLAYLLDSVRPQLEHATSQVRDAVHRTREVIQRDMRTLRQTMVELHPHDLSTDDFASAIGDLTTPLRDAGVRCTVEITDSSGLSDLRRQVLYRAARELVRNVASHARATELTITVTVAGARAELVVADNGMGFDSERAPEGHLGLRLLAETVRDSGGELTVESAPGAGATARVSIG